MNVDVKRVDLFYKIILKGNLLQSSDWAKIKDYLGGMRELDFIKKIN